MCDDTVYLVWVREYFRRRVRIVFMKTTTSILDDERASKRVITCRTITLNLEVLQGGRRRVFCLLLWDEAGTMHLWDEAAPCDEALRVTFHLIITHVASASCHQESN
jgi:hypothetical protein